MRHGLVGERAVGGGKVNFRDLANKHLRRIFTLFYSQEGKSRATRIQDIQRALGLLIPHQSLLISHASGPYIPILCSKRAEFYRAALYMLYRAKFGTNSPLIGVNMNKSLTKHKNFALHSSLSSISVFVYVQLQTYLPTINQMVMSAMRTYNSKAVLKTL